MVADLELSSTNMLIAKNGGLKYPPSSTGEKNPLILLSGSDLQPLTNRVRVGAPFLMDLAVEI